MDVQKTIPTRMFQLDLVEALKTIANSSSSLPTVSQTCLHYQSLESWTQQDRKELMKHASQWLLEPSITLQIAHALRPVVEELVYLARRAAHFSSALHPQTGVSISLEYNIRFASALSKLCRVSPACLTTAKQYFAEFDVLRPLESLFPLLQKQTSSIPTNQDDAIVFSHVSSLIIEVLRTTWRLVKFSSFPVNQAVLLGILQKCETVKSTNSLGGVALAASEADLSDLFYKIYVLASQSLLSALGLSDSEIQTMGPILQARQSPYLAMVDEEDASEYQLMMASSSWSSSSSSVHTSTSVNSISTIPSSILTAADLQSGLVDVSGFLLPSNTAAVKDRSSSSNTSSSSLIITPTTSHNLEALALAIGNEKPVLLLGPTGSGKTALITHVAAKVKRELTTIHIGEALDGKNLLGGYVATENPGQFKWVEGPLTRAVRSGHWLIIEDLDMASPEVWGILQPLVQSRHLFIPSRAETIVADHGFSLFATATTHHHNIPAPNATTGSSSNPTSGSTNSNASRASTGVSASSSTSMIKLEQSSFWTKVVIDPLSSDELALVIQEAFGLGQLAQSIVSCHESLVSSCSRDGVSLRATERPLTTRDVLRWAKRTRHSLHVSFTSTGNSEIDIVSFLNPSGTTRVLSSGIRELAVKEALDVYISPSQHSTLTEARCNIISNHFQISQDRMEQLCRNRPTLESTETTCIVGRSSLSVNTNPKTLTPPLSTLRDVFVPTTTSLGLLEWLAAAVQHVEPVLLVGETGGGKTSTIQHLAARTRRKLVVLNMSQSSDTVDLLGGFKPVDLSMLATPLKRIFDRIFIKTFSKTKNQDFLDRVHNAYSAKDWRSLAALFVKACKLATTKFEQRRAQEASAAVASESTTTVATGSTSLERETKRRKVSTESGEDEESLRLAFASFDDLDAETFPSHLAMEQQWKLYTSRVQRFGVQVDGVKAFQYVEGALVKAVQRGEWVLLDEINLASAETLECLSGLLEGGSLVLSERGDLEAVHRHPDFRLFAAMNPANDVGKSNLPAALRARFSEFYLRELEDRDDIAMIVQGYLARVNPKPPTLAIVDFYLTARKEAETRLVDGANQKPRFNLRSLSRSLEYTADTTQLYGFDRALLEGIQLAFLTQLNTASYDIMNALIHKMIRAKTLNDKMLKMAPSLANFQRSQAALSSGVSSNPSSASNSITFEQFMLEAGPQTPFKDPRFIVTQTTQRHLTHLARALTTRKYPLLLQGPTSAGKTSMIEYLAKLTGHRFVRVNNSDQTDLQEYLGQYIHDAQGRLVYHDGVLVEALRHGHWIVLDELNLAPSEVLEALNRLLDDNRQLYVPELQEYITPHPHFCLFATQNPPGLYGGRKVLSRAFRSRFLELHIDEIPESELQIILEQRAFLPASYCTKLVAIMKDLQRQRQGTQVFAGRHGFVTLRDLFRWAERHPTTYDELAMHGYFLLADRLRENEERDIVKQVLEKHLKVTLDMDKIYESMWRKSFHGSNSETDSSPVGHQSIVWTEATKRLYALMSICLRHKEPILLVGPPGTGKTAISQLHAEMLSQHLEILNCHQNSEAADFIGGLRPVRGKDALQKSLENGLRSTFALLLSASPLLASSAPLIMSNALAQMGLDTGAVSSLQAEIESLVTSTSHTSSSSLERLVNVLPRLKNSLIEFKKAQVASQPSQGPKAKGNSDHFQLLHAITRVLNSIEETEEKYAEYSAMFLWYDGPLVRAMKRGHCFLIDEISLAEDAVLERLNSVLEPSRLLVLAEKGGREIEELVAHPDFRILATMNPGGDFGKKELSPALRNRFTEIFVPAVDQRADLIHIILQRLRTKSKALSSDIQALDAYAPCMVDFVEFFSSKTSGSWSYSLRDILAWADFVVATHARLGAKASYLHGASMLVLDGLGITNPLNADSLKAEAQKWLATQELPSDAPETSSSTSGLLPGAPLNPDHLINSNETFGLGAFTLAKTEGMDLAESEKTLKAYSMRSPTTLNNLLRLLRSLQLPKPLLLEGSPGVGKTTIVEALGAACGRKVVRINLSEQTDMLDLLGADLPVEDDLESLQSASVDGELPTTSNSAKFEWRDGVFLNALKNGDWVLLDELNLANQSVLEGLNAVLDHRGTVFIPELNASFVCPPTFRIFAAQNPTAQGGGRKGLPKSFLNRFTKVYLDSFTSEDLNFIANAIFPELGSEMIAQMVQFNTEIYKATMETFAFGRDGAPWEFNLRDILRWCKLVLASAERVPDAFVQLLYLQRFRTEKDRAEATKLFEKCFKRPLVYSTNHPFYQVTPHQLHVGQAILKRQAHPHKETHSNNHHGSAIMEENNPVLLQSILAPLESLMKCVELNWLAILVGPTASGKTSLIQLLATLTGNKLSTFSVNPSVDTLEILGGFEQIDLNRHAKRLIERLSALVSFVVRSLLQQQQSQQHKSQEDQQQSENMEEAAVVSSTSNPGMEDAHHLMSMWNLFQSQLRVSSATTSMSGNSMFSNETQRNLTLQLLDQLDLVIARLPAQVVNDLNSMGIDSTDALRREAIKIRSLEAKSVAGSFEWVDGLLIEAMERGHWIVMDNVNTCPGPVLDRLLPLLEPNGVLRMNERGLVDGKVTEIVPHPNFRIFFTMDPKYGDISRAMRNRGIEIGMVPLPTEVGSLDMEKLLARSLQFFAPSLFERMTAFHNSLSKHRMMNSSQPASKASSPVVNLSLESASQLNLPVDASIGLCDLLHWAELTLDQLQRGESLGSALTLSMEQVYARGQSSAHVRALIREHFMQVFSNLDLGSHSLQLRQQLLNTPGFTDQLQRLTPQASALSLSLHSQALLGSLLEDSSANSGASQFGDSVFFALEHLVRSCSTHWAHHWTTMLCSHTTQNASAIFGSDKASESSASFNQLVNWMMEQFHTAPVVSNAAKSIETCLSLLLGGETTGKVSALQWKNLHEDSGAIDLRSNVPLWRLLETIARRNGSESMEAYVDACAALDRVRLWCQTLPHQFAQSVILNRLTDSNFNISSASIYSLSLVEQSLALTLRKINKTSVTHPLATLLSSFFTEVDSMLEGFINTSLLREVYVERLGGVQQSASGSSLVIDLQLAINLHHHLWKWVLQTSSDSFSTRDFVPALNWLIKSIGSLHKKSPTALPLTDAFKLIVEHMNAMIQEELGAKYKMTLWKKGGHAFPLKSQVLFSLQSELDQLQVSRRSSSKELHGVVLSAMATLMWINTFPAQAIAQVVEGGDGRPQIYGDRKTIQQQQQIQSLFSSLKHVPQTVATAIQALPDPLADVAGSSQQEALKHADLKNPLIMPLFDHYLLQLEVVIVQKVQEIIADAMVENNKLASTAQTMTDKSKVSPVVQLSSAWRKDIQTLAPAIQSLLSSSIDNTFIPPRQHAGYKLLSWIIDSESSASPASSSSDTFEMLISLASELKSSLVERTLNNSISTAQLELPHKREGIFLPPIVIELQKKSRAMDMTRRERLDDDMKLQDISKTKSQNHIPANDDNYLRIESAYRTAYTFARLNEWTHVPVVMKESRMEQMKTLLAHLASTTSSSSVALTANVNGASTVEIDWNQLLDCTSITLSCFTSDIKASDAIENVRRGLRSLLTSAESIDLEFLASQLSIVASLPSLSSDVRFAEIAPAHVGELVKIFESVSNYASRFWTAVRSWIASNPAIHHGEQTTSEIENYKMRLLDEPIMKKWRGQALLSLSLLRSSLLIPSQPIDVSTKYASRAKIIASMQDQVQTRLAVLKSAESKLTGRHNNDEIEAEAQLLERVSSLLSEARERQVSRPSHAPEFHSLWAHMQSLYQANCQQQRYNEIVRLFEAVSSPSQASSSTIPSQQQASKARGVSSSATSQWPSLLVREGQLQNNLTQAITSLQAKFQDYYPDIVAPFVQTLFEIKRSLRVIRNASELMIPSSRLIGSYTINDTTSVSSLMTNLQLQEESETEQNSSKSALSISLYGPSLSCRSDSMYAIASHLQQVVTKLVSVPRAVTNNDVALILSKTTFDAVSALARLNQARAQASQIESQAHASLDDTKGTKIDSKVIAWMQAASRTGSILKLQAALLRSSLDAVFEQARTQGYISKDTYDSLDRIFTVFVQTYQSARAEEEKKRAAEAEFYKYKTRDTKIEHQHDVDESSFKSMFPDYYEGFEDILGPNKDKPIDPHAPIERIPDVDDDENDDADGEDAFKRKKAEEEAAANSPAVIFQGQIYQLTDGEIYQLCRVHFKVFSVLRTYLQPGVQDLADATQFDEIDELEEAMRPRQKSKSKKNQSSAPAPQNVDPTSTSRWKRQAAERNHSFMSAYETASKLVALLGEMLPRGEQDSALDTAHILALQQFMDQLTAFWRNSNQVSQGDATTKKSTKMAKQKRLQQRQRRLKASQASVVTSFMSSHELVPNFYTSPNPGEASLLQETLSLFQARIEELLALEEIGENQVLITLWKLVARLLEADVTLPLMHFVTGLELLIERSQDWDLYQPVRYGIRIHMDASAKFVTRWRAMELQFWPLLLTTKEQEFQHRASKWWFHLYSLLQDFATKTYYAASSHNQESSESAMEAEDSSVGQPDFAGLLSALQEYIENSSYGEFATRLHLLASFYYQFQADLSINAEVSKDGKVSANNNALVTMIYNVYRYYAQFLPLLQVEMFKLKEAVQLKLEDFIKISRWDDSTFYRLRKTTEASHRTLGKISKQYESEVLSLPFRGFLEIVASNERLEQLKSETSAAAIVSTLHHANAAPSSSGSPSARQTLDTMKSLSQQLLVPSRLATVITESSTSSKPLIGSLSPQLQSVLTSDVSDKRSPHHLKLESLFNKVTKHSSEILPKQMEFAHRSHVQLERLTVDLISGILEMRAVEETPVKKRAFAFMLSELKTMGLDFHKTAIKQVLQQQSLLAGSKSSSPDNTDIAVDISVLRDMKYLFSEPICEEVISKLLLTASDEMLIQSRSSARPHAALNTSNERAANILTDALDTYWAKSDDYFYKVLAQVFLLRSKENSHSPQLSRSEAQRSLGFADHIFALLVHQRRTMSVALERHETVEKLGCSVANLTSAHLPAKISAPASMDVDETEESSEELTSKLPSQVPLRRALVAQKQDLDVLTSIQYSMFDLARTLLATESSERQALDATMTALKKSMSAIAEVKRDVECQIAIHCTSSSLSRVFDASFESRSSSLLIGPHSYLTLISSDLAIETALKSIQDVAPKRFAPSIEQFQSQRAKTLSQRDPGATLLLGSSESDLITTASASSATSSANQHFLSQFLSHVNTSVESILLAVQRVYKLEKTRTATESKLIQERQKEAEEHRALLEKTRDEASEKEKLAKNRLATPVSSNAMDVEEPQTEESPEESEAQYGFEKRSMGNQDDEDDELGPNARFLPLHIVEAMKHLDSLTISLDAPAVIGSFSSASTLLSKFIDEALHGKKSNTLSAESENEKTKIVQLCSLLLQQLSPLLKQWSSLHLAHVHSRSLLCKSSAKFGHVLVSVMASVMNEGFCIKPKTTEGEGEQGDTQTDVDGMGLGEGTGEKDVTDQYDDEEQLLGDKPLQDLKKDDPAEKDPSKPPVDPDTGVEMENDFEGEMHDIEKKDDKKRDDEDEEDEEGDLMDREMGDLDPEQEEVLDEKLWDSEDEDNEDEDGKKGKEKYEKNAPLEGENKDEPEMEAKVEEDASPDDSKKQQQKKDDKKKQQDGDDGDNEGEDDDDGDDAESGSDGSPDEHPDKDEDPVHNQDDDLYEDNHHKKPHGEEEEFELPEDMNLDDDDKEKAGEENAMDVDEDKEGEDGGDDKDDDAPKPFPEQPDEQPEGGDGTEGDKDEENPDKPEGDDEEDNGQQQGASKAVEDQDDAGENEEEEEHGEDDEAGENPEEEREKVGQSRDDGKDYSEAFGVTDDRSLPQQQNVKTSEDNKQTGGGQDDAMDAQGEANDESADQPASASSTGATGATSVRPTPSKPSNKDDPNAPEKPTQDRQASTQQKDANPLRSLGDALKQWQRQLNVIEDREDENQEGEQVGDKPQDETLDADKNQTFEFARENEQADQQTLGIASEEQAEQFKPEDHQMALADEEKDEEALPKEEPQKMDVDETTDPEQTTTVETKSRAPSNKLQTQKDAMEDAKPSEEDDKAEPTDTQADPKTDEDEAGDDAHQPNYDSIVSNPAKEKDGAMMETDDTVDLSQTDAEIKELTPEDILEMRSRLEETIAAWKSDPTNVSVGGEIWRQLQALTSGAAQQLCEQLRLLLEPTLKSKMQGDYRTGKRLNMRRVVTYVASQFRKDKIWLRRTMPNKRTYQVLLCLDDSQSVQLGNAAPLMREATATLCLALQRLQIGQISLLKFGAQVDLLHPFSTPFTDETAATVMPQMTFEQQTTNMENLMRTSIQMMELSRHEAALSMGSSSASTMQLMFVIGDGRFGDKRQELSQWLHRAQQSNIFVVFLIMDTLDKDQSILDIQSVASGPGGKLTITPYIDDFPFSYYIILKHLDNLPHILSDALRQWFEMVNQSDRK